MTKLCLIAGNYQEARIFARAQNLDDEDWFFPMDKQDLLSKENFIVIVIGTAGMNTPTSYFNSLYELAQKRGRINRV